MTDIENSFGPWIKIVINSFSLMKREGYQGGTMDNTYFMSSYEKIKEANERLNKTLVEQDNEFKWKNKEEYDDVVGVLLEVVNKQLDEMLNTRVVHNLSRNLTGFLMELGFDEQMARAKASDMISVSRRH